MRKGSMRAIITTLALTSLVLSACGGSNSSQPTTCVSSNQHNGGAGKCVPAGTCSAGYSLASDGATCVQNTSCATGSHDNGAGVCVANTNCPTGYHDGGLGTCIPIGSCSSGYQDGGGGDCTAIGTCSSGYHDGGTRSCVPLAACAAGYINGGDGTCVQEGSCARGYNNGGDGRCVPAGTCSTGYHNNGISQCVLTGCAQGYHNDGSGKCVSAGCATGYHDDGTGTCATAVGCAAGYHDGGDGSCVLPGLCSPGYYDNGAGVCLKKPSECPGDAGCGSVALSCISGYHNGGDGTCSPNGTCAGSYYNDGTGLCRMGYSGVSSEVLPGFCRTPLPCSSGFHDDGAGNCVAVGICATGYYDNGTGLCCMSPIGPSVGTDAAPIRDGSRDAGTQSDATVADSGGADGADAPPTAGALTTDKISMPFGAVGVGDSSPVPQVITITNTGATAAPIAPTVTGPFAISQTCVSVPAKGTCQISVVFTPTAVGPVSGVLSITGTLAVSLSGTGVPKGNFSVADVSLGQVATNVVVPGAVTVTATNSVTDLACSLSGADLTADPTKVCPAALAAGASCTVGFTFKATTSGQKTDSVVCNAAGLTKTAVVSATVLDPAKLVITPISTTFQTPNGTQSAPVTFGVANSGGLPTGQVSATLTGTNANQFAITVRGCLAPLAGASGCAVQVVCNPTSVGTKIAALTVADATTATDTVTAALTCVSVGPTTITVTGTANLGSVVVGSTGAAQTFTVTNTGTTATGTLAVSVADPQFVKSADACTGTSLAPGATCTVAVALKPSAPGPLGTILDVTAASGTSGSIQLSGTGLSPGALTIAPA